MSTTQQAWRNIAEIYGKLVPPDQPSAGDMQNYGQAIAPLLLSKTARHVLILGSTPHLRDLVRDLTFAAPITTHCLDLSTNMYRAMTQLLWQKNPAESFTTGSWLEMPFQNQWFDLVVGDLVICQLEQPQHEKLFQEVARVLAPRGCWVTRHNITLPQDSDEDAFREFLVGQAYDAARGIISLRQLATNSIHRALYAVAARDQGATSLRAAFKYLESSIESPILQQALQDYAKYFTSSEDVVWTCLSEEESEAGLKKYFTIVQKTFANDHVTAAQTPVYTLVIKN